MYLPIFVVQCMVFKLNTFSKKPVPINIKPTTTLITYLAKIVSLVLVVIAALVPFTPVHAQEPTLYFEHITLEDGLSDSTVYSIAQDTTGYLWFGTQDGLNKYNGYNFTIYKSDPLNPNTLANDNAGNIYADRDGIIWIGSWGGGLDRLNPKTGQFTNFTNNPNDPHSLSFDRVQTIFQDKSGAIWVGTAGGGLNKFDSKTETFSHYKNDPNNPNSISNDRIWRLAEDNQGMLWVATSDGLNKFDPQSQTFTRYFADPDNPRSLSHSLIRTVYVDNSGTLWVGTEEGLNRYNPNTDDFDVFLNDPSNPQSLNDNTINAILEDSTGRLWVGTSRGGLNLLNRQDGTFTHILNNPLESSSLSYNDIRWIHEDNAGVLWFATRGGGVNKLVPNSGKFIHFGSTPGTPVSLNNNDVRAIYKNQDNTVWIGTKGGGLNIYNPQTKTYTVYQENPDNPNSLSSNDVYAIYKDDDGIFWLGTSGGGLNKFDPQTETFTHYKPDDTNPTSLSSEDIQTIYKDRNGTLWIGTKGGGLNKFDPATEQFTRYQHNPNDPTSLSNNDVYTIHQDSYGTLWVGTYGGGLNKFDPATESFTQFQYNPEDPTSLSNNNLYSIVEDKNGILWIGTANGGLNAFDPVTGQFTRYTELEGLPSDVVYSILEDNDGYLWLSTNNGLSKFNPTTGQFINYSSGDGLERVIYREGASHKDEEGKLYFGGINGLTKFNPTEIIENNHAPLVVLTRFSLLNQPVQFSQPIDQIGQIELSYEDDVLSFEFAALDFTNPAKNHYAYMLEGFDDDWIDAGSRPFVTYTNLDPGQYVFKVKGANNAGVEADASLVIPIEVTPPFWETWWFRILAVLVVLGIGLAIFKIRVSAIEAQRNTLEVQVKERTLELSKTNLHLQEVTNRLQSELDLAQEIQQSLLPPPRPNWAGLDIVCYSKPALEVGGDFYAYHEFSPNGQNASSRYAITVGDVSGKGLPAALLMGVSLGSLQSAISQSSDGRELLLHLNDTLRPYNQATRQNCALCYVELNGDSFNVLNAGGVAPIVRYADGSTRWIDVAGLPLGIITSNQQNRFIEANFSLSAGDMLILISDGVIEATTSTGEMYGFERFEKSVSSGPLSTAQEMLSRLQNEIDAFMGDDDLHDDFTIVVLKM